MTIMKISPIQIRMSTLIPLVRFGRIMQELDISDDDRQIIPIPKFRKLLLEYIFFYTFDQIGIIACGLYFLRTFTTKAPFAQFSVSVIENIIDMIQVIHDASPLTDPIRPWSVGALLVWICRVLHGRAPRHAWRY